MGRHASGRLEGSSPSSAQEVWTHPNQQELGACHCIELGFVFHTAQSFEGIDPPTELMDQVQDAWIQFARHGDPNHDGLPQWPPYESSEQPTMVFNTKTRVEHKVDEEMLRAFDALGVRYGFPGGVND